MGDEFFFVPCTVNKKVILWRPRWDKGGILAFSQDAVNWSYGGNEEFEVIVDEKSGRKATWNTGKNVPTSGLTDWGTFDPENDESGPAAQEIFEYMVLLPELDPSMSPVLLSAQRTGIPNAKNFNTSLFLWNNSGKPIYSLLSKCFSVEQAKGNNHWYIPGFKTFGVIKEAMYLKAKKIHEEYKDYLPKDYEDMQKQDVETAIDDKIAY